MTKSWIIAATITATALLGGGYALTQMGSTPTDGSGAQAFQPTDTAHPIPASPTPAVPAGTAASLENACSGLFNRIAQGQNHVQSPAALGDFWRCATEMETQLASFQHAITAQFDENGAIAQYNEEFATIAHNLRDIAQIECEPTQEGFNALMQQGLGVKDTALQFAQNYAQCISVLDGQVTHPQSYLDDNAVEHDVPLTFKNAVTPVNQEWVTILKLYSDMIAGGVGQDTNAIQRLRTADINI